LEMYSIALTIADEPGEMPATFNASAIVVVQERAPSSPFSSTSLQLPSGY
jgi:hypothetical protein